MANSPLQKIVTASQGRGAQLEYGPGNNQYARASDFNPVVDYINDKAGVNSVTGTGTTSTTINAMNGTAVFTGFSAIAGAGATQAFTVTDANISAANEVVGVITASTGTGIPVLTKTVCSAGQVVFTIANVHPTAGNTVTAVTISFIVF